MKDLFCDFNFPSVQFSLGIERIINTHYSTADIARPVQESLPQNEACVTLPEVKMVAPPEQSKQTESKGQQQHLGKRVNKKIIKALKTVKKIKKASKDWQIVKVENPATGRPNQML